MKQFTKQRLRLLVVLLAMGLFTLTGKQTVNASTDYDAGTLAAQGTVTVTNGVSSEFDYIKFVAPQDGYVTFTANNIPENDGKLFSGQWFICNSAKTAISSSGDCGFWDEDSVTFAVKGNKTYYLKIVSYGQPNYQVDYTYQAVKDKSGNKRSKAALIKKNKLASGLLMAGEKKADWYKIKLTKKQVLKLTVSTKSYRGVNLKVYDKKGNEVMGFNYFQPSSTTETVHLTSKKNSYSDANKKLEKGTYYIKVYCLSDARACGYYSLRWK